MTRYSFYIKCIGSLSQEHLAVREEQQQQDTAPRTSGVDLIPNNRKRDCCVCSDRKTTRRQSRTSCIKCDRGLHVDCLAKHKCQIVSLCFSFFFQDTVIFFNVIDQILQNNSFHLKVYLISFPLIQNS